MVICARCRREIPPGQATAFLGNAYHANCYAAELGVAPDAQDSPAPPAVARPDHSRMPITTTPSLDGYRVLEVLDIVSAEYVLGINVFRDFLASVRDIVGGRSETTQRAFQDARRGCLLELREEAAALGANAVIGVDLDYSEISGGGKSMLFLVASGTAVRVERAIVQLVDDSRHERRDR